jgi:DNA-binding HxlR family transcriptional regulator
MILEILASGDRRFNQLQAAIPGIAHKVLIDQLRELEQVGVIHREAKAAGYRRVHYSLTEAGRRLLPVIRLIEDWGRKQDAALQRSTLDERPTNLAVRSARGTQSVIVGSPMNL